MTAVERLVQDGRVHRAPAPPLRRVPLVRLTPAGREALDRMPPEPCRWTMEPLS